MAKISLSIDELNNIVTKLTLHRKKSVNYGTQLKQQK